MQLPQRKESFQICSKNEAKKERKNHQPGHFPSTVSYYSKQSVSRRSYSYFWNKRGCCNPRLQSAIERGYQVKVEEKEREREGAHKLGFAGSKRNIKR